MNLIIEKGIDYFDLILRTAFIIISSWGITDAILNGDKSIVLLWVIAIFYCIEAGKLRIKYGKFLYNIRKMK